MGGFHTPLERILGSVKHFPKKILRLPLRLYEGTLDAILVVVGIFIIFGTTCNGGTWKYANKLLSNQIVKIPTTLRK